MKKAILNYDHVHLPCTDMTTKIDFIPAPNQILTQTIVDLVRDSITDEEFRKKGSSAYHVSEIDDNVLDYYVDSLLNGDHVISLGIHTIILINRASSLRRVRLEYTALCYLLSSSRKIEPRYKTLSREQQLNSPESIVAVVSMRAYRMFQGFMLGYLQFVDSPAHKELIRKYEEELKAKGNMYTKEDMRKFLDSYKEERKMFYHLLVIVQGIGSLKWPSKNEFDDLFQKSRFTRDVFDAYKLVMIRKEKRVVSIVSNKPDALSEEEPFYVQLTEDWL